MGSAESLADKMLDTRHHVGQEAFGKVRDPGQKEFKSKYAKEFYGQRYEDTTRWDDVGEHNDWS